MVTISIFNFTWKKIVINKETGSRTHILFSYLIVYADKPITFHFFYLKIKSKYSILYLHKMVISTIPEKNKPLNLYSKQNSQYFKNIVKYIN